MSEDTKTAQQSRETILRYIDRLDAEFVARREIIELMSVALAASEPMLLLGPPGTGKSDMIIKFCQGIGLSENEYFEYMITAFTEPSEIIGPIDIKSLREEGTYRRILDGKIAEARVVFLDEIFHGNSAILNILLTILNERKIYQEGEPVHLDHLTGFFASTNQIPQAAEFDALKDRFVIKAQIQQIHQNNFSRLLNIGIRDDIHKSMQIRPWIADEISIEDFHNIRQFLRKKLHIHLQENDYQLMLPEAVMNKFFYITQELESKGIHISDREVIKLCKLVLTAAYLLKGHLPESITEQDLFILRYVAETPEQFVMVRKCVNEAIGLVE